jgi:RNA binding exosome subunit
VRAELDDRVDDNCSFFLTFDKQAAFGGSVERGDGITLRAKVEAYPAKRAKAVENARELLEEL